MSHTVHIPTPLRQYTEKLDTVQVGGATVGELLTQLTTIYPELKKHLYNEQGKLRHFVNIYVNDEDIRYLQKEATALGEKETISIIPSVAGGSDAAVATMRPSAAASRTSVPRVTGATCIRLASTVRSTDARRR